MSEHTPGPWGWKHRWLHSPIGQILWYTAADDGIHCRPEDARLIAASPKLLGTLKQAAAMLDQPVLHNDQSGERGAASILRGDIRQALIVIRAAIAEAESSPPAHGDGQ